MALGFFNIKKIKYQLVLHLKQYLNRTFSKTFYVNSGELHMCEEHLKDIKTGYNPLSNR